MGMARSLYEALAGTWLFRYREPAAIFVITLFPFIQLYAWSQMGLLPLWGSHQNHMAAEGITNNNNNNNNKI